MNTPNPLVPQGTFTDKGKSHIRITVFAILAIHVVLLGLLLIAGCNKKPPGDQAQDGTGTPSLPQPPPLEPWPAAPTSAFPAAATQQLTAVEPPPLPPVPAPGAGNPPTPGIEAGASGLTEHTIAKGESFYTLGKKYGVGFKAIADANPGVNPTRLKIGDKIKIPAAKSGGAGAGAGPTAGAGTADNGKTYKVKSGDNLMKIAKTFGVPVKQLRSANNLKTDQIKVGQTLKIPAKAAPAAAEAVPSVPAVPPVPPPSVGVPPASP